jgi:DNA-binding XRE family transcriptional regulator
MTPTQLKKRRIKLGFTQTELADAIVKEVFKGERGLKKTAISAMENGQNAVAWYVDLFFKNKC